MNKIPQIRFTWLIHYLCNYLCPYCFYYEGSGWEILKDKNLYLSPGEWIRHWRNIYDKYGRSVVIITGGEPFIYPDFVELIKELSKIHYPINISSNASTDLDLFVKVIDPQKVSLSISFQPQFEKLDPFLDKLIFLRKYKFDGCINLVAYPPFLKQIKYYRERFNSIDKNLEIIPFRGIYKEQAYPWSYTDEELSLIEIERKQLQRYRKKGTPCIAGKNSVLLLPDATVVRCGQVFYRHVIGNFLDPQFKLLDQALPCDAEFCPCDENIIWGRKDDKK